MNNHVEWERCLRVEEGKCHSSEKGGPREVHDSQPHLDSWEGDGVTNPGNYSQACDRQGGDQE